MKLKFIVNLRMEKFDELNEYCNHFLKSKESINVKSDIMIVFFEVLIANRRLKAAVSFFTSHKKLLLQIKHANHSFLEILTFFESSIISS